MPYEGFAMIFAKFGSVVCQMLGFDWGATTLYGTFDGGSGDILMDDVQCHGNEYNLGHCVFEELHNCVHEEDAGVSCHYDHGLFSPFTTRSRRSSILGLTSIETCLDILLCLSSVLNLWLFQALVLGKASSSECHLVALPSTTWLF